MTDDEVFELVRDNYTKVNKDYLNEQIQKAKEVGSRMSISCKNCEWAGYCTWDENAVICEKDIGDYIPADKVIEEAETCSDYCEVAE